MFKIKKVITSSRCIWYLTGRYTQFERRNVTHAFIFGSTDQNKN